MNTHKFLLFWIFWLNYQIFAAEAAREKEFSQKTEPQKLDKGNNSKIKENNKRFGEIVLTVQYFEAFSEGRGEYEFFSNNIILNGISWKIQIINWNGFLEFSLCRNGQLDFAWNCQTEFELSIVSSTKNGEFHEVKKSFSHLFTGWKWQNCFDGQFGKFEQLMDKSVGLYNEEEDTMTFKAKVKAEKPFLTRDVSADDTLLLNGQMFFCEQIWYDFEKKSEEVSIGGMPWQILIVRYDEELAYEVSPDRNCDRNFEAAIEFGIVSTTTNDEWLMREGNLEMFEESEKLKNLFNPINRVYDKKDDAIIFKAEIIVKNKKKEPIIKFQAEDKLMVNGQVVKVNKYLLAAHSEFFKIFFNEFNQQTAKIEIDNDENAVGKFEKLISLVNSPNAELDDDYVENVLLLADRFQLASVLNRCANFFVNKSKKPFINKILQAHQYNIIGVKEELINDMFSFEKPVSGPKQKLSEKELKELIRKWLASQPDKTQKKGNDVKQDDRYLTVLLGLATLGFEVADHWQEIKNFFGKGKPKNQPQPQQPPQQRNPWHKQLNGQGQRSSIILLNDVDEGQDQEDAEFLNEDADSRFLGEYFIDPLKLPRDIANSLNELIG
ncbi:hypothetical protein niasHS_016955 [Heterodera schachtii]|uniref:BTB domain-containing protein n=1 Tax=Heterodera schachtii TaxID=97005 RepID=A0ABD2HVM3_HETSC